MAGEDLGSVYYTVDADTSGVLKVKNDVVSSVGAIESNLKRVDTQVTKTAKGVTDGMNGMKNAAQNFSYQIHDIAVQLAGGQSPFLIIAQQLPQMLVGMGAAAAGIGALVAVAGGLAMALYDSSTSLDKFKQSIENIQASITLSATGVAEYTEQMKTLASLSAELAKVKIANLIAEQQQAFKDGAASLREYTADVTGLVRGFGSFESVVSTITAQKLGKDGFDEAKIAVQQFRQAATEFSLQQTADTVEGLELALKRLSEAGASSTQQGRELINRTIELISAYRAGEITLKAFNEGLKDNKTITTDNANAVKELVKAVEEQAKTYGFTDRELAIHAAKVKGASEEDLKAINIAYDRIESLKREEEAVKNRTSAINAASTALDAMFEKERRDDEAIAAREYKRAQDVTTAVTGLAATPLEKLQAELQAQYDLIAEYETLETANHQTALDARAAADAAYLEKVKALTADQGKSFGDMMAENGASLKSFQASAVGAFTAFATGAMSGEEALRSLAQSILTQMIGALVQMGIQALIGQATATAGAVASGATIATAMAPAAALTSLASFGANAAPAAAGITSTVGLAQGLAIAGGRLYGGYTAPNSMYKVTENGRAEMFSDGRDSFLMTGSRGGSVTPNGDLGGNSQPIINITTINNANGTDVSVQQSSKGNVFDVKFIVDTVASNISSGGKIRSAITQSTTAKNRVV